MRLFLGFLILISFFSMDLLAETRHGYALSVDGSYRSRPLSGGAEVSPSYALTLWGEENIANGQSDMEKALYGYAEVSGTLTTSLGYYAYLGEIAIYPVSFVKFAVGYEKAQSRSDYDAYDCVTYRCTGDTSKVYSELQISLAYQKLFYIFRTRLESWDQQDNDRDFIEPTTGLSLSATGDDIRGLRHIIGYQINKKWIGSFLHQKAQADKTNKDAQWSTLNVTYSILKWRLTLGYGPYQSDDLKRENMLILNVNYNFKKYPF